MFAMFNAPVDQATLTQALGFANAFAFGAMQVIVPGLSSKYKPVAYMFLSTLATVVLYYGLSSNNPLVHLMLAGVTAGTGVTGAVDFYKRDAKKKEEVVPIQ